MLNLACKRVIETFYCVYLRSQISNLNIFLSHFFLRRNYKSRRWCADFPAVASPLQMIKSKVFHLAWKTCLVALNHVHPFNYIALRMKCRRIIPKKKWIEKRCSFWMTFLSRLHCSHPETRNWICRETVTGIRYTWGRARLMATFARYSRVLLSLTWDLTRTGKVFLYQESQPPHDTPHASFLLTTTTTTMIHLTHCGETFKNLKTSRASRCFAWILHRGYYFFVMVLRIFLGVSISTNLTEAK